MSLDCRERRRGGVRRSHRFCPESVQSRTETACLVFLAFFFVLFALVVFAHDFAVSIDLDAPLFPTFIDDGFVVRALFFPANNFSAFSFRLGGFHHHRRHVRTADGFFFVFLFFCLRDNAEGESGTDRCDCEQLRCIHGYLVFDRSVSRVVRISKVVYAQKLITAIAGHRPTTSLRSCETQTEENKKRTRCAIEPLPNCFICAQSFAE